MDSDYVDCGDIFVDDEEPIKDLRKGATYDNEDRVFVAEIVEVDTSGPRPKWVELAVSEFYYCVADYVVHCDARLEEKGIDANGHQVFRVESESYQALEETVTNIIYGAYGSLALVKKKPMSDMKEMLRFCMWDVDLEIRAGNLEESQRDREVEKRVKKAIELNQDKYNKYWQQSKEQNEK